MTLHKGDEYINMIIKKIKAVAIYILVIHNNHLQFRIIIICNFILPSSENVFSLINVCSLALAWSRLCLYEANIQDMDIAYTIRMNENYMFCFVFYVRISKITCELWLERTLLHQANLVAFPSYIPSSRRITFDERVISRITVFFFIGNWYKITDTHLKQRRTLIVYPQDDIH